MDIGSAKNRNDLEPNKPSRWWPTMAGSSPSSTIMESLFQRTLDDLIKGLRIHPVGLPAGAEPSAFLAKALDEIRREVKSTDPDTKATALHKLAFLHSLHGLDMSWASFHVVEALSFPRFALKKVAYLAASLSFHDRTDVALLVTNQLRKDLASPTPHEAALSLQFLSVAASPHLARDLTPDVFALLSTSKPLVRKKAIAVILRIFAKYPDAVRVCFRRLYENLESSDPSTVSAVVGVFCELAVIDPASYLPLAPEFYKILVDSRNNWVLIKVLKIFGRLCPLEPRLAKRVVEPICDHMRRTGAKSLAFECVRTVVTSLSDYQSALRLSVQKIHEFLLDEDPNLRYLGLQALGIMGPNQLWAVLENKEVVIRSLSDQDPNIKHQSLRLVMKMVSEHNVVEFSKTLVNYALKSDPGFCNEILGSILATCSRDTYEIVVDFDWYVSLLGEISRIPHCQKGEEIEGQLVDIGMRVKDARPELVRVSRGLLIDPALLGNPFMHRILSAAAWVSGEYVEFSKNPFELMEALLQPRTTLLPPSVQAVYMQSAFKVLIFCLHSYVMVREIIASTSSEPDNLNLGTSDGCQLQGQVPADSILNEEFNPRNPSCEGLFVGSDGDIIVPHWPTAEVRFSHESIVNLVDLTERSLRRLLGSHEVEIMERARNVLGLIELIRQEIPGFLAQADGDYEKEELRASKIIKLTYNCFTAELGPISVSAQGRVPIPEGLILKDNLCELETICGEIEFPSSSSFSLGCSYSREGVGTSVLNIQSNGESEPSTESTSLLAQHRKRHGLYYLPLEKSVVVGNDYPPANDLKLHENLSDDSKNLAKLAEQSLVQKKKPNRAKPRPLVVKLDEGDASTVASLKPELKDDVLSGAVREFLTGMESAAPSLRNNPPNKSSSKRKGKDKLNENHPSPKENTGDFDKPGLGNSSSGRRKQHGTHGKDRRPKGDEKVSGEREEGQKGKHKSSHRHGRHRAAQGLDDPPNVVSATPVIPDFLL